MYDPDKFASHAGVRTDLFNRPVEQTLITDFFGGVSQVEVLAPEESYYPPSSEEGQPLETDIFVHGDPSLDSVSSETTTPNNTARETDEVHGYSDLLSIVQGLQNEPTKKDVIASVRTWLSSGLMTALVAWVSTRK